MRNKLLVAFFVIIAFGVATYFITVKILGDKNDKDQKNFEECRVKNCNFDNDKNNAMNICGAMNSTEDVQNCAYNVEKLYENMTFKCWEKCKCKTITCERKQFETNKEGCYQQCDQSIDDMFK